MLFKKSKRNTTLDEAIKFIKLQKTQNKKNIKIIKDMNISVEELKRWDNIYDYIILKLKSMRK